MNLRYPVNYIVITQGFSQNKHRGLDLGWNSKYGGKNQPIYAAESGTVITVEDNNRNKVSWGNYVKISHGNNIYTLYGHLKDGIKVKKGQSIKKGELIGYMGNTGNAVGEHLHYEIYDGGSSSKYRVDPLKRTYVYPEQIVSENSKNKVLYFNEIKKSIDDIVQDVILGIYGNQPERRINLENAGYNYSEVQTRVNEILNKTNDYYIVKKGDTLSEIALKYNTTVKELVNLNNIKNVDLITKTKNLKSNNKKSTFNKYFLINLGGE